MATSKGKRNRGGSEVVSQINQLVARNAELERENARLHNELAGIASLLNGGSRGGKKGGPLTLVAREPKPKRTRKPITDPEQLERRKQALAKAREARSARLAEQRQATEATAAG